jgi:hypothetical protein
MGYRNVGEWCKKEECWETIRALTVPLLPELRDELVSIEHAATERREGVVQGADDARINAITEVVRLRQTGCWARLMDWSDKFSPIYGKESDLARNASYNTWVPSDAQAMVLMRLLARMESTGFKR